MTDIFSPGPRSGLDITPTQLPTDSWQLYEEKRKREATTSTGDYFGAMWRQDSPVDGLVAHTVGRQFAPDPAYAAFEPNEYKRLTDGLPQEFHKEFYAATSKEHADFIRMRLDDKMSDMQKLGDLGIAGTTGRLLFGLVEPSNLLAGVLSGGVSSAYLGTARAAQTFRKARGAAAVEGAAAELTAAAQRAGSKGAMTAGLTNAALMNAGFEKLRQSVNFEDDAGQVLESAVIGTLFATPFVALNSREWSRVAGAADLDRRAIKAVRKVQSGEALDAEDHITIKEFNDASARIAEVETGRRAPEVIYVDSKGVATKQSDRVLYVDGSGRVGHELPEGNLGFFREQLRHELREELSSVLGPRASAAAAAPTPVQNADDIMRQVAREQAEDKRFAAHKRAMAELLGIRGERLNKRLQKLEAEAPIGGPDKRVAAQAQSEQLLTNLEAHLKDGDFSRALEQVHARKQVELDELHLAGKIDAEQRTSMKEALGRDVEDARVEAHAESELADDFQPFGKNTAGGAQAGGTHIEQVDVSPDVDNLTSYSKARFDIFARLNASSNPAVRELGHLMVKDAIGNSKNWAQRETVTERKRRIQRTLGGKFHWEAREAFDDASKALGLGVVDRWKYHETFYEDITRAARGETLESPADAHPFIERAASTMREVYADMAKIAEKSGLEGAEFLKPNATYVNRVWNHNNIREATATHGEATVVQLLADAIQVPGLRGNVDKAGRFLKAVMRLEHDHRLQDIQLHARDMVALRKELEAAKLSKDEIDGIVDVMFEQKQGDPDAGKPGNLRYRFDLDETHMVETPNGELRLSSLFENDSRLLIDKYLNTMAGHSALAERGIKSQAEFRARIEEAQKWHAGNESMSKDAVRINDEVQILDDMNSFVIGRPMSVQAFSRMDRAMGAFRAYTRSVFLGQLGVAAAFELKNAVGLASFRALSQQSPTFTGILSMLRSGRLPNRELAQFIEAFSGFGLERAAAHARQHEVSDFTYDRGLTRAENFANTASHAVDIISGNNFITSATRQFSAAMMIQKLHNFATKTGPLDETQIQRLVNNGIDREHLPAVLDDLKAHAKTSKSGTVLEIDYEGWQAKNQKTFDMFVTAFNREVRDAIQDHDIGETGMWMHRTWGKVMSELRTFNLAAHSKQFLKGIHYRDRTTAMTWSLSFAGECLAYSMQQSINFAHNPAELEKRLNPDMIWRAALQRMSVLGISSYLLDTGNYVLTGDPMFKKGGTTNTDNRNLFMTPSFMAANRLLNSATGAASAANPFSADRLTKQNAKDMMSTLPGGNTWVMRNINDYVSSQFPKRELNARQ